MTDTNNGGAEINLVQNPLDAGQGTGILDQISEPQINQEPPTNVGQIGRAHV